MIFCKHQREAAWKYASGRIVTMTEVECSIAIGCDVIDTRIPGVGRSIVRKVEEERKTATGLFLPDSPDSNRLQKTLVLAVDDEKPEGWLVGKFAYIHKGIGDEIEDGELVIFSKDVLYYTAV